ncbi:NAD-dependent epimerase/dehydratase family protein [Marinicrinis lubricantis]|uniref:NAD-dependent epimerase/dehydratase family protein n=1 Tax=Marinicrinis lubricantis TaxID=2086470 RepID=A0ABW1IJC9_9BACL
MKKVLITGGAGNLAKYMMEHLLERGYTVTAFDKVSPEAISAFPKEVLFVQGDLTSMGDCMRAVQLSEADAIIHLGALPYDTTLHPGKPRVQRVPEDECMKVNTMGTYYVMEAARRFQVKTVLMASSYYTLGLGERISSTPFQVDYLPIDEAHPNRPEDTYALSKVLGEEILQAYSRAYGIRTVAFRLQGIDWPHMDKAYYRYGITPEARPDHVGGPVVSTLQYLDPRDAAQAFTLAMEADHLDMYEVFYLLTDSRHVEETKDVVVKYWPDLADMAPHLEGTEGLITQKKLMTKLNYKPQYSWRGQI